MISVPFGSSWGIGRRAVTGADLRVKGVLVASGILGRQELGEALRLSPARQ